MSHSLYIAKLFKRGMPRQVIHQKYGFSLKKIDSAIRRYVKPGGR